MHRFNILRIVFVCIVLYLTTVRSRDVFNEEAENCTVSAAPIDLTRLRETANQFKSTHNTQHFVPYEPSPFDSQYPCSDRNDLSRIVGGEEATPHSMPWMVYLRSLFHNKKRYRYVCAGAVISKQWVLTAAHCVSIPGKTFSSVATVLGAHNIYRLKRENVVIFRLYPRNVFVHPRFNYALKTNDIALLKLPHPWTSRPHIRPACLPLSPKRVQIKDVCVAAGWGLVNFTTHEFPRELQKTTVEVKNCIIMRINICTGTQKFSGDIQNTCSGDSGSPLMCSIDGVLTAVGILSYGFDKCETGWLLQTHYTDVKRYLGWIQDVMGAVPGI